ncbi:winged helix-turn-helix domain-containing protein [Vibrio sp. ER1A]|uniref:winged helix-turn-helix domain-containing protein n=1 Tax=Vibrio sp. ER1A TaxID=1517681 RepID=UPI0004DCCEF5|nr:winged helix-turn-helix domain-containing protein [Vibrio sp. ER1A]KFA98896.1 transcriptional regulator [Vibrio sp. ER1A]
MDSIKYYVLQLESPIVFYPSKNKLEVDGAELHLEPLQSRLLKYFVENQGQVLTTQQIADNVWQRNHVSDNLVRQVISSLRGQLKDKARPYRTIKTIPKKGYLFDLEVIAHIEKAPQVVAVEVDDIEEAQSSEKSGRKGGNNKLWATLAGCLAILAMASWIVTYIVEENTGIVAENTNPLGTVPVYIHDITSDSMQDYQLSESVYNYLFYGLNSSRALTGYHFSQLSKESKAALKQQGIELKGWLKKSGESEFLLTLMIQNNQLPSKNQRIEKSFNKEDFFTAIGDVVLEIKALVEPKEDGYEVTSHRVSAINNYDDWEVISDGISQFYLGGGNDAFVKLSPMLENIQSQGRGNYLVSALLSYSASVDYLQSGDDQTRLEGLKLGQKAFELNPRCDIANLTLGLALLLNQRADQAIPYLFYAAKSTPTPIGYYLLSVADKQVGNLKGADFNYQHYVAMKKESGGQLYDLIESLQKSNLIQTLP